VLDGLVFARQRPLLREKAALIEPLGVPLWREERLKGTFIKVGSPHLLPDPAQRLADDEEHGVEVSAERREAQVCSCREPIPQRTITAWPAKVEECRISAVGADVAGVNQARLDLVDFARRVGAGIGYVSPDVEAFGETIPTLVGSRVAVSIRRLAEAFNRSPRFTELVCNLGAGPSSGGVKGRSGRQESLRGPAA
jgi:hypothetical protein